MGVSTTTMAKSFPIIGLLFVAALALAGTPEGSAWFVAPTKNIVELAADIPDLSTLVTALKAGKLTTALSGAGPFTVFAPTNEAFAALPSDTLTHLLDPKNIKVLDAILEYHVIAGAAVRAEDLKASQDVKTLEGQKLHITKDDGAVTVQNAKVIQADVGATNGIVHVIDSVLFLPPTQNIVEVASGIADLSTLVTALKAGKLITALSGGGPFTVFAPTNEAFAALPPATLTKLLDPTNIKLLRAILEYHVLAGAVYAEDLKASQDVTTLEGQKLHITKSGSFLKVGSANVLFTDVGATNGVVHTINGVLIPPPLPTPAPTHVLATNAAPVCMHQEDTVDHKCFEACAPTKFAMKGIHGASHCPSGYNTVDKTRVILQCPDGLTSLRYCVETALNVTVETKGEEMNAVTELAEA